MTTEEARRAYAVRLKHLWLGHKMKLMTKQEAREIGATQIVVRERDLRPESLAYLRSGATVNPAMPIELAVYPDSPLHIVNGRHRIFLARERGETSVIGRITGYGPRGGKRWSYAGKILI
jgi:hypothetical protein